MPDDPRTTELGRFAEPALLVLVSLAGGAKHGYAIMTDVESFGGTSIGPGTLYAVLARLERRGLIEPLGPQDRRRPYRLTTDGAAVLEAKLQEMGRFVRAARARQPGTVT